MDSLDLSQVASKEFEVKDSDTAVAVGSGGTNVLASPVIVAWVENTAFEFLEERLDSEQTSVGVKFELNHIAPTPVGIKVFVEVTITETDRNKVTFNFKVKDDLEEVAYGTHTRVVVDREKFLLKANKKNEFR